MPLSGIPVALTIVSKTVSPGTDGFTPFGTLPCIRQEPPPNEDIVKLEIGPSCQRSGAIRSGQPEGPLTIAPLGELKLTAMRSKSLPEKAKSSDAIPKITSPLGMPVSSTLK